MIQIFVKDFNKITQESYDKVVNSLPLFSVECTCGYCDCLTFYGHYKRYIKKDGEKIALWVRRVMCSHCKHTHAILISFIVPYSQTGLIDQIDIIAGREQEVMERNPQIDESNVRYIIRQYRKHFRRRINLRSPLLGFPDNLVLTCFKKFHCQFMQIRKTRNILFPKPT